MSFKSCFLSLIFILASFLAFSQEETAKRINLLYLEAGGIGGYGSFNYERLFPLPSDFDLSIRAGLSTSRVLDFHQKFNPDLLFPIALNVHHGSVFRVHLGVGQIIANNVTANPKTGDAQRKTHLHTAFVVGMRYHKEGNRWMVGLSYTPILEFQKAFRHWGAVSVGWFF